MSEEFYFILFVLQECERGWFMGLLLVSMRPYVCVYVCVCVCVCVFCHLLYQTAGLAPLCSGHSTLTGRLNCDWWRSEFYTNQNWQDEKTHEQYTAHAHSNTWIIQAAHPPHSPALHRSLSCQIVSPHYQVAALLFHRTIFRDAKGPGAWTCHHWTDHQI